MTDTACPCGSGRTLMDCCGRYLLAGERAPTAEALMRSRYTAFVRADESYLLASWHPQQRPRALDLQAEPLRWQRLEILRCEAGGPEDAEGRVEFIAHHHAGRLHEISRFHRLGECWYYWDGRILADGPAAAPGRNSPCPCGSGKKYKRCCGA